MYQDDPIHRFQLSLARARESEAFDATRAALATADGRGAPSVRFVLVKHVDARGFVFFTNFVSRKGQELADNPRAALAFHWASTGEQVRVGGTVQRISDAESDAYFAERPRPSQLGAWVSPQSRAIDSREALEREAEALDAQIGDASVTRPPFWGGYRIVPAEIEFWLDRPGRLHDRFHYTAGPSGWTMVRLAP